MIDFQEHVPALRSWLLRRLRNSVDVDDAMQDIWLRSQAHLAEPGIDNPRAYLFRTARSVLLDRSRRATTRRESWHEPLEEMHHPVEAITPDRILTGREAVGRIIACLDAMPPRTRHIFVLHRFEEISYAKIARQLCISTSAVEKHIMKALRLLIEQE